MQALQVSNSQIENASIDLFIADMKREGLIKFNSTTEGAQTELQMP